MSIAAFQSTVSQRPAPGVPGDRATLNPVVYTLGNPVAEGEVTVGHFVWRSAASAVPGAPLTVSANAGVTDPQKAAQPLGLVERVIAQVNGHVLSGASMRVLPGTALTVARRGDYYVCSDSASQPGDKVFAHVQGGGLSTAPAGTALSHAVETAWTVVDGGDAQDIITISHWS